MGELKRKTINGVAWSAVERFSVRGVQFVLGLVLARLLTPSDYGLIAMLTVFMSLSYVFIDGGFANALIQSKNRTEEDYSTVFYINLSLSVFFYFLLFFSAPYIARFYNQPELELIARIYMLNLIVNSFVSINRVKVTIDLNFKIQARITFWSALISGITGIFCAYCGMGAWALVVQMMLTACMNWILFAWFVRWFPKLSFSKKSFNKLFGFGFKIFLANLLSKIYANFNTLIIGKVYSPAELGIFNRGHRFADFASSNISVVLKRVAFPVLSQLQDNDEKLLFAYSKYIKFSTFVIFPLMMGMCGIAKPFVLTVLTSKWADCIIVIQILCFAYMLSCVSDINLNILYAKGRSDLVLRLEIAKKTIAIVLLLLVLQYGIVAICLSRLLYSIIALYLNSFYTKRILNYGLMTQVREFLPALLMSFVVVATGLAISNIMENQLFALVLSFIACPLVYVLIARLIHHECLEGLVQILKKKEF